MKRALLTATALVLLAGSAGLARNIDLVTLPPRDTVQLTIYNSEDLTLVKETRSITFKKGSNRLQFSWAGTLIDPTSVYFRPLEHEGEIEVLDTTFPGDRPQVLIWEVDSKFEGQAQVRLVVGVVNLVERIAQLAQGGPPPAPGVPPPPELRARAMKMAVGAAEARPSEAPQAAPRIVKEGLSEYFIFTVEGEQTVKNGWAQRMVSFKAREVPFEILYRLREHQYGPRPVRFFILANDEEHKMGESPLPDGVIRVFRDNGKDGLAYYTTQATKYIPIKEKVELNVGTDDEIVYERSVLDVARSDFIYDHSPPRVVGWNETRKWQEEIRNYRAKAIKVEIRHVLGGHVEFAMEDSPKLFDYHTVEYVVELPARQTQKWTSEGLFHLGRNQKQNRVELKKD